MDVSAITEWLKTTVPGIILLGAVGSLLAVGLLWALRRLCVPIVAKFFAKSVKSLLIHFAKPAVSQLTSFIVKNGSEKLPLFYTLQVMKLVVALFVATCAFILFCAALAQSYDHLARTSVLAPLIISFLALWYGFRCVAVVMLPLHFDIEKKIEETKVAMLAAKAAEKTAS